MKKKLLMAVMVATLVLAMSVPALAAVETVDINSVMETSFQEMVTNMMGAAAGVLPICMTVLGLSVTIGFGIKWFKKLIGKA